MARRAYPRPQSHHERTAVAILQRHARATQWPVSLPVPIEMIVERTYTLEVHYDEIAEPTDVMILGALSPSQRRITFNTAHAALFDEVIGPERFTLAHELAHWVYDAEDPGQQTIALGHTQDPEFCYHRGSSGISDVVRLREVNANKLAAALLLPAELVRAEDVSSILAAPAEFAARCGVSRRTLEIRLETLGLA